MDRLYNKLKVYSESDFYPFHMPGHKRNTKFMGSEIPYHLDITEIDGFDNLHHAEEILKGVQEKAAQLYQAEETHYLINGSTAGILSAVMGCTEKGGKILMARNCHKSVYHAVYLNELRPVYLYPRFYENLELNGEILLEDVKQKLEEYSDIQAVVITSPTYDGVLSDIEKIAAIVHEKNIPLIVDEAHGAHFGLHKYFPENSNIKGADIVIHSLHKTLPSLTQTALIHINGTIVNRQKVRRYLQIFQTSSPSYILMSSMDECIRIIEERGNQIFEEYVFHLEAMRKKLKKLRNLRLLETGEYDRSKIVISVKNVSGATGKELYQELLEKYHLQMEMAAGSYILAMTAVGDTKEGMDRLTEALFEIDRRVERITVPVEEKMNYQLPGQEQCYSSYEMEEMRESILVNSITWKEAAGRISLEYAYLYPPGIPLVVPGERISQETADLIQEYQKMGFAIEGTNVDNRIEVWINE